MTHATLSSRSSSEYLATLPPEIQDRLAAIVRTAIGMNVDEKAYAIAALRTFADHFAARPLTDDNELFIPAADAVAEVALLVRLAHERSKEA